MKGTQSDLFAAPKAFDLDPPVRRKRKDIVGQRYIVPRMGAVTATCPTCGVTNLVALELDEKHSVLLDMNRYAHGCASVHTCQSPGKPPAVR